MADLIKNKKIWILVAIPFLILSRESKITLSNYQSLLLIQTMK
ncbi:hypothetical protein J14TS2_43580 [Bacillus sp. J14TS2]|nr:hypothetical protein J14TS2_43580 [Bacillus sp. J14TS2]